MTGHVEAFAPHVQLTAAEGEAQTDGWRGRQQVRIPIVVYTGTCEQSEDSEPLVLEAVEGLGWRKRS